MKNLTCDEMKKIEGGISIWAGLIITSAFVFLSGVLDGIVHPKECGKE